MPNIELQLALDEVSCAWRILRLRDAMEPLRQGAQVQVSSADPELGPDLEAYLRQAGHKLLDASQNEGRFVFLIRKEGGDPARRANG